MYDSTNVFAKILRGEVPCFSIYEDDYALAFNDINPEAPVHVLVITKAPYTSFEDFSTRASNGELLGFWKAVRQTINKLNLAKNGYRLVTNIGKDGGQEIPHFHVHILAGARLGKK